MRSPWQSMKRTREDTQRTFSPLVTSLFPPSHFRALKSPDRQGNIFKYHLRRHNSSVEARSVSNVALQYSARRPGRQSELELIGGSCREYAWRNRRWNSFSFSSRTVSFSWLGRMVILGHTPDHWSKVLSSHVSSHT